MTATRLGTFQAIAQGLAEEMRRDPRVVMFGEGVGTKRRDLVQEFGDKRVRNTPLAEGIIAGTAAGAAGAAAKAVDAHKAPASTDNAAVMTR